MTKTRLYRIWSRMKERCYSKTNNSYQRYGGRGIGICPEWRTDYAAFQLSIDRIDNGAGYSPSNCRWATHKTQQRNRRCNHVVEHGGRSITLAELSEITGISYHRIHQRLRKGWPLIEAIRPVDKSHAHHFGRKAVRT